MSQEELVDIIDASLKRKGAIDREIKNPKIYQIDEKSRRTK